MSRSSTPRFRAPLLVILTLAVLAWTAGGAFTQGQLKGKVLPVVSSSDVIGYITPCGLPASGAQSPASTTTASPYLILVLSTKLARRASPPLGVCQPQGVM